MLTVLDVCFSCSHRLSARGSNVFVVCGPQTMGPMCQYELSGQDWAGRSAWQGQTMSRLSAAFLGSPFPRPQNRLALPFRLCKAKRKTLKYGKGMKKAQCWGLINKSIMNVLWRVVSTCTPLRQVA